MKCLLPLEAPSGHTFTVREAPALLTSSNTEKQVMHTHGLPHMSAKRGRGLALGAQVWTQVKGDFLFPLVAWAPVPSTISWAWAAGCGHRKRALLPCSYLAWGGG